MKSAYMFNVNKKGEIRFGLGAIKGVGEGAVENIVNERLENGYFNSIYDLTKELNYVLLTKEHLKIWHFLVLLIHLKTNIEPCIFMN